MLKKKTNYEVKTKTKCLEDTATGQAGAVAYQTFMSGNEELSNAYHIPYHAICSVKVKTTTEEVEFDDPTCMGETPTPPTPVVPYFEGVNNESINQGTEFSLTDGVKAYDGAGNEIPFTVEPSELDTCEVGQHHFTYSAQGVTAARTITVREIANPTISGLETLVVEVNEEFDPLEGVSAVDGNGNEVEVTYEEPPTPIEYLILVDVTDYTAPTLNKVPMANAWEWDFPELEWEAQNVYADGVQREVVDIVTEDDARIVLILDNDGRVMLEDTYDQNFISRVAAGVNEVVFGRLVVKYPITE